MLIQLVFIFALSLGNMQSIGAGRSAAQMVRSAQPVQCVSQNAYQDYMMALKISVIAPIVPLIWPLVRLIVEYDPCLPFQWIPFIDTCDEEYQYNSSTRHMFNFVDFKLFKRAGNGLKVTGLTLSWLRKVSSYSKPCINAGRMLSYSTQARKAMKKKLKNNFQKRHQVIRDLLEDMDAPLEARCKKKYGICLRSLNYMQYLLQNFRVMWVAADSEVYERAVERSLFMLDHGVTVEDVGRCMTVFYKKLKSFSLPVPLAFAKNPLVHHDAEIEQVIAGYVAAYEQSRVPSLLRKAGCYGDLVPILYRVATLEKTRKRMRQE